MEEDNTDICLSKSLKECLKEIAVQTGYKDYKVGVKPAETSGGCYMGVLYNVVIEETNSKERKINLFIKEIFDNHNRLTVVSVKDMYLRELFVYCELQDIFTELQAKYNVPMTERFKIVKGYKTNYKGAIIMNNMSVDKYSVADRMEVVSLEYSEKAVTELAKFHALSFIIQNYKPQYFENNIEPMNFLFKFNDEYESFLKKLYQTAQEVLDSDEKRDKFQKFSTNLVEKYLIYYGQSGTKMKVLCHGDYRVSNILIRKTNEQITDLIPIDYQTIYFGNPLDDFMYFVFGATDRNFRSQHLQHLKALYYNTLTKFLSYFELNVETFYPKEEFEEDYETRLYFGLMIGTQLLPFILAPKDAPNVQNEELSSLIYNKTEEYCRRINDLVEDFIDWKYI